MNERIKRVIDRANTYFAMNWAQVPFQPMLYTFLLVGAVLVITIEDVQHPALDAGIFWQWIALSIICPVIGFTSWVLIKYWPGKPRVIGFWIRAGADMGQLASMTTFLTVVSQDVDLVAPEIYATQVFAAVWWFIAILVVRDVWKLVITERLASMIEHHKTSGVVNGD